MDVKIKTDKFSDDVKMDDILSIPINVGNGNFVIRDFVDTTLSNAIAVVTREDGNIQITVESDIEK